MVCTGPVSVFEHVFIKLLHGLHWASVSVEHVFIKLLHGLHWASVSVEHVFIDPFMPPEQKLRMV